MKLKVLIGVLVLCVYYSCNKQASAKEINVVTVAEMETHLKYNHLQLVDVQPPTDYKKSHLLNATNILFDKDFRKNLDKLDKNLPVAIYCTTGNISPEAAKVLKEVGFKHIYILEGGIKKWDEEKFNKN